jgi:hypothetical protein
MSVLLCTENDPELSAWYGQAVFTRYGSGCETVVFTAPRGSELIKLKLFKNRSEFQRHLLGLELLRGVIAKNGWTRWLSLPLTLGVDTERLGVLSRFVVRKEGNADVEQYLRAGATTALICAAGQVAELGSVELGGMTHTCKLLGLEIPQDFALNGVDVNSRNLIYDGLRWWAVDF